MVLSFDNCWHNKVVGLYPGAGHYAVSVSEFTSFTQRVADCFFVRVHGCRINERANKGILIQWISYTAFQLPVRVDQPLLYLIINCFMHYNPPGGCASLTCRTNSAKHN